MEAQVYWVTATWGGDQGNHDIVEHASLCDARTDARARAQAMTAAGYCILADGKLPAYGCQTRGYVLRHQGAGQLQFVGYWPVPQPA